MNLIRRTWFRLTGRPHSTLPVDGTRWIDGDGAEHALCIVCRRPIDRQYRFPPDRVSRIVTLRETYWTHQVP